MNDKLKEIVDLLIDGFGQVDSAKSESNSLLNGKIHLEDVYILVDDINNYLAEGLEYLEKALDKFEEMGIK